MIAYAEPASVGQRMLWLIQRQRGQYGQLNYPLLLRLRGDGNQEGLSSAIDRLVARHETLRTTLARRHGLLTQLVHEPAPVPITRVDTGPLSGEELERLIRAEATNPVDPSDSPIRVTVWHLDDRHRVLCLNTHHFATDALSCRILTEDVMRLLGTAAILPRIAWQYRHFVRWQRRETTVQRLREEYEYWRRQLAGAEPVPLAAAAPPGFAPPGVAPTGVAPVEASPNRTIHVALDRAASGALHTVARTGQTTLFTVLLAIYYAVLHRETGALDLSVAAPFANRTRPEIAGTVGFFANMLILRTRLTPGIGFAELVRRTHRTVHEAQAHQSVAYYAVPGAGDRATDWARLAGLAFQLLPDLPGPVAPHGLEVEVLPPHIDGRFDFEITAIPHGGGLRVLFQYAPPRIDDGTATGLAAAYRAMATRVAAAPDVVA
jgi:hypothetical protein